MRGFAVGLALVFGIALSGDGGATVLAAQAASGERLTFDDAVRTALERNPSYVRGLNAVTSAEYSERQSFGSAFLPSVGASLSFRGSTSRNKTAFDELGRPLEEPDFVETTTSSASQGVSLGGLNLLNFESWRQYSAALARTDARAAAADLQAAQLRTQVGTAYFGAVQAERLIDVEERQLESARQQLAAVRELLRVAARQPTDVLGAELAVAQAEQSLQQARGTARKQLLQLKQTMGVELERSFELATGWPPVFDPTGLDQEAVVRRALEGGPRMAQEVANVEAADRGLAAARAGRLPTVDASASWGRGTSARGYQAFGELNPPNQSVSFSFGVSIPVFSRFGTSTQIGQAALELDNAEHTLREARLQIEREVRSAIIDLESAYSAVRLAERSAEIARERLRQGQELYRLGSIGYTDLQRMYDDVAAQERGVVNAYNQFATALLQLEEKVGGGVEPAQ